MHIELSFLFELPASRQQFFRLPVMAARVMAAILYGPAYGNYFNTPKSCLSADLMVRPNAY